MSEQESDSQVAASAQTQKKKKQKFQKMDLNSFHSVVAAPVQDGVFACVSMWCLHVHGIGISLIPTCQRIAIDVR
jgi:hypothetical protein